MMKKERNTVELPEELVVEILSRVPALSLARFRSISKGCNALIKDWRFAKKHSANALRRSLVITLADFRVSLVSFDLHGIHNNEVAPSAKVTSQFSLRDPLYNSSVDIRNVFHCNGLLLCTTEDKRLVVWNPCSGESRWIKPRNSYKKFDVYALGYDNKSSCYKILRVYIVSKKIPYGIEFEVYDFTSNSWKGVGETKDWFIPGYMSRGVFVNGNIYWVAMHQDCHKFLLSFDFTTERFRSQSLPHSSPYDVTALSVVREEQLSLLTHLEDNPSDIRVWMTSKIESTGIMSWTKFLTAKTIQRFDCRTSFLADEQSKAIVCCYEIKVPNHIFHIVAENRYFEVDLHCAKSTYSLLLGYVPTLVQIQQGL